MKRGWLLNIALLAVVALLTWLALRTPSRDDAVREPLSAVRPSAAARIALTLQNRPPVVIERRGQQWWILAPLSARADEFQVMRMLTILDAQPSIRLPAADLQRFGLNPPSAILDIDGVQYAFGGINTVTREQYVMRGDAVYTVELRHGAALPAQPDALIRRALLDENQIPVAITLPGFSIRKTDGRWELTPASENAGADALQAYIDQWRHASANAVGRYDNKPPLSDINIEFADNTVMKLGLLQREPQLILWRRDNGLQYTFPAIAGRTLLDVPGTPENRK